MNKERFEELCAAYALGAIDPHEIDELKEALRNGGSEYESIFRSFNETALHLSLATDEIAVDASMKKHVMGLIEEKKNTGSNSSDGTWLRLAAMLLVGICLILGYFGYQLLEEVDELEGIVEQQRMELIEMEDRLLATEKYLDIISSRNTQLVNMGGLDPSPTGFGRLYLDTASGSAVLQVADLPATPADKDYQLWIIRDNEPVSAGVFSLQQGLTNSFLAIDEFVEDDISMIAAVAITLEPKGGMPQPTGDMYLIGTL